MSKERKFRAETTTSRDLIRRIQHRIDHIKKPDPVLEDFSEDEMLLHGDPYLNSIGDIQARSIHDEEVEVFRERTVFPNED